MIPALVASLALLAHSATLNWTPSDKAAAYTVYRAQGNGAFVALPGCTLIAKTTCVDTSVTALQSYRYAVVAFASATAYSTSNTVRVTVP